MTTRKFLCCGCHKNPQSDEVHANGMVSCTLASGPVQAVPYEKGMKFEQCQYRKAFANDVHAGDLPALARLARKLGTAQTKKLEQALGQG